MAGKGAVLAMLAAGLLLSACSGDRENPRLMNLRSPHDGPDEFAILPTKPLEMPKDFTALPEPQPGRANLVDQNPLDDAVVALGGRPGAGGGDAALVAAAGRHGIAGDIRDQLAEDDAKFRRGHRPKLFERIFGTSTYTRAYQSQAIGADEELERWRRVDRRTPAATPDYAR